MIGTSDIYALAKLFTLQWRNASAMRASFAIQVFGMAINNGGIMVAWVLFMGAFGTVNGWGAPDVVGMLGVGGLSYGLAYLFCHGAATFAFAIRNGTFDSYLLRPRRLLPLVWRSAFAVPTIGDCVYGTAMIALAVWLSSGTVGTFFMAITLAIPAAMVLVAVSTIINSYSFWFPEDRTTGDMIFRVFITPSMYPVGAFPTVLRVIFTVIIPSILVSGLPWDAARQHAPLLFAASWFAGFAWLGIAALVFRAGLKRYESGGGV